MSDTSRYARLDTQEIKDKISQQDNQVKYPVTESKSNESNLDNLEITEEDIALMRKELNAYKIKRENKIITCLKNLVLQDSTSKK
jgi:hypothetical protein